MNTQTFVAVAVILAFISLLAKVGLFAAYTSGDDSSYVPADRLAVYSQVHS